MITYKTRAEAESRAKATSVPMKAVKLTEDWVRCEGYPDNAVGRYMLVVDDGAVDNPDSTISVRDFVIALCALRAVFADGENYFDTEEEANGFIARWNKLHSPRPEPSWWKPELIGSLGSSQCWLVPSPPGFSRSYNF